MGGASIVLRSLKTKGNRKKFKIGQFSLMNPLYLLKIVFPKFDPITATGMVLCADIGPKY
jgi:hypothetical protein